MPMEIVVAHKAHGIYDSQEFFSWNKVADTVQMESSIFILRRIEGEGAYRYKAIKNKGQLLYITFSQG